MQSLSGDSYRRQYVRKYCSLNTSHSQSYRASRRAEDARKSRRVVGGAITKGAMMAVMADIKLNPLPNSVRLAQVISKDTHTDSKAITQTAHTSSLAIRKRSNFIPIYSITSQRELWEL